MDQFNSLRSGVLPDYIIKHFIETNKIINGDLSRVQPSSLDILPDLNDIYELDQFYPPKKGENIRVIIKNLCNQKVARKIKGTTTLKRKKRYLIPVMEHIQNVPFFCRTNPKSSPGRIFLHTRLLTDGSMAYDEVYPYHQPGKQWLLITPKSFCVTLAENEPVCQLRFFKENDRLSKKDLDREMLWYPFIKTPSQSDLEETAITGSAIGAHILSIDMESDIVAYKTKNTDEAINIGERSIDWTKFYEEIHRDQLQFDSLPLEQGPGYLFGSLERIKLPENIAAEVSPYVDKYGEIRAHFAGYIDPGFGLDIESGNSITFEVIAHEKGISVRHNQSIGEIQYEYMAGRPTLLYQGNYKVQPSGPQLPKYFKK